MGPGDLSIRSACDELDPPCGPLGGQIGPAARRPIQMMSTRAAVKRRQATGSTAALWRRLLLAEEG